MLDAEKPKRPARKPAVKPAVKRAERSRKTISLDAELARRLAVYAASLGRDQSDIVAEALEPILRGFYWGHRGQSAGEPGRFSAEDDPAGPRLAEAV